VEDGAEEVDVTVVVDFVVMGGVVDAGVETVVVDLTVDAGGVETTVLLVGVAVAVAGGAVPEASP